jgi:hypothetical protein
MKQELIDMAKSKQKPLLTTSGAANALNVPYSWVERMALNGIVKPRRDSNGRALYGDADIALLRKQRQQTMKMRAQGYPGLADERA